ncbi:hypothetical protein [Krasilnikovia sp. MM14-A1259]|uniref:hypothetical protein n=1 Tax=Krasilnikovia sp. MM14-A1259 TaxID=3373539 RepID=UPI0038134AE5
MTFNHSGLVVDDTFDEDNELRFTIGGVAAWIDTTNARRLRDHLTAVLGDSPASTTDVSPGLSRTEALKAAEDAVSRLSPATNARGYADVAMPLAQRTDAILRLAGFLLPRSQA